MQGHQDGWVIVKSSDKTWSAGGRNGKPLQYSCLENPMNNMKRQKERTLKDESPRSEGVQHVTGEEWRIHSRKMKRLGQSRNNTQLWLCLLVRVKSNAVKNNIA